MSEKISVVVPVFNIEKYVERCAYSILNQTYANLEIIMVDDGSTDGSGKIIDQIAASDSRIKVIHKENGGVTSARMAGIKSATGEWIGFVDGDDEVEPDMFRHLLQNAIIYQADISHCGYQMVFPDGRIDYYYNTGVLERQDNMPVDADDLLNCNNAEYCKEHPKENGLVSDSGYVWQVGKRFLRKYPQMYEYCGSCNIIKMYRDDLPDKCPAPASLCHDKETAAVLNLRYPIRYDHNTVVRRYAEEEKPFSTLPFCSTVYVLGTGDNISAIFHNENSERDKRFHPIAFLRNINPFQMQYISRKIKKEFCIE